MPASRSAATICSDSACFARGSLAPCAISSGILMSAARDSGDRDHRKSASVSGLPTRLYRAAFIGAQQAGMVSSGVLGLDGPTISPAHVKKPGLNAAPTSAAYPPYEPP